jgi:methionyl-tRNA synthetase
MISIDDFTKVELRTAEVLEAAPHPDADRLLVLQLALGEERRQIVAGIREHYAPESMVGKTVVVVANLQPVKLRGVESQGMLLAVKDGERVVVLTPDAGVSSGLRVS